MARLLPLLIVAAAISSQKAARAALMDQATERLEAIPERTASAGRGIQLRNAEATVNGTRTRGPRASIKAADPPNARITAIQTLHAPLNVLAGTAKGSLAASEQAAPARDETIIIHAGRAARRRSSIPMLDTIILLPDASIPIHGASTLPLDAST